MSFEGDVQKVITTLEELADNLRLNVEGELDTLEKASNEARTTLENKVDDIKEIEDEAQRLSTQTSSLIKEILFVIKDYKDIEDLVGKAQDIEEIQLDGLDSTPDY